MDFIRSSLIKDHVVATEVWKKDLPTSALSHLIITLDGNMLVDELTLAEALAFINKIEVTRSGVSVLSMSSEDLYGVDSYLFRKRPVFTQKKYGANLLATLSLIVPFGRRIFDPNECYPATKKGDLTLSVDTTLPVTTLENAEMNIETIELPGANPRRHLKSSQMEISAPGKLGDNDIELPTGNDIVCIQVRMTTMADIVNNTFGVNGVSILVENKQFGYSYARATCLIGDMINLLDTQHGSIVAQGDVMPLNIVYVDYDPVRNDELLLHTLGKSSVKIRLDMGVDEATNLTLMELVNC